MQINVDEYRLQECRLPTKCSTSKNGQAGIQLSGRVYPACTRDVMISNTQKIQPRESM